jgi:hemin uptake protein HemP
MRIIRIKSLAQHRHFMKTPSPRSLPRVEMPQRPAVPPRPLVSAELFGNRDEILIAHDGETYRLRRTRQGKLILTK